jgi:thiosulfate reductase cytochrome b subunit
MNKSIFYTGIVMLLAPFILILGGIVIYWLIQSVSLLSLLLGACGISYFVTAIWLIVKGVKE